MTANVIFSYIKRVSSCQGNKRKTDGHITFSTVLPLANRVSFPYLKNNTYHYFVKHPSLRGFETKQNTVHFPLYQHSVQILNVQTSTYFSHFVCCFCFYYY